MVQHSAIDHSGLLSLSYGSNATRVRKTSGSGSSNALARADHFHDGISDIISNGSNTLSRGALNLRMGTVTWGLDDSDGDGVFDRMTLNGGGGTSGSSSTAPGYEFAYAAITADVTTTSTSAADATGLTVTYTADGAACIVEAYIPELRTTGSAAGDRRAIAYIYDTTGTAAKQLCVVTSDSEGPGNGNPVFMAVRLTPSAGSQSYKVQFNTVQTGTATIRAAAGNPAYIRVTKV